MTVTKRSTVHRHPLRELRRVASWHRRKLAVVAAVASVLTAVSAAAPAPAPTTTVVRASTQLAAGALVGPGDVSVGALVVDAVPAGALGDAGLAVGHRLVGPLPRGQVITAVNLLSESSIVTPGHVIAPLRLADPDVAALLHPGTRVDVIAADAQGGKADVVAANVAVLTVPERAATTDRLDSTPDGALVLLDVDRTTAASIARATVGASISVVLLSG